MSSEAGDSGSWNREATKSIPNPMARLPVHNSRQQQHGHTNFSVFNLFLYYSV